MNTEGMLPFENRVSDYVQSTGHHVLYRVTPCFEGNNLVATGVLMEGLSIEDSQICFCVFAYNVQPYIVIDYATGDSSRAEIVPEQSGSSAPADNKAPSGSTENTGVEADYIGNKNTKKFHYPTCSSVSDMKDKNKYFYTGTREGIINEGYEPCGRCKP